MRLPPVWVAVLTASTTLSLSNSISAKTLTSTDTYSADSASEHLSLAKNPLFSAGLPKTSLSFERGEGAEKMAVVPINERMRAGSRLNEQAKEQTSESPEIATKTENLPLFSREMPAEDLLKAAPNRAIFSGLADDKSTDNDISAGAQKSLEPRNISVQPAPTPTNFREIKSFLPSGAQSEQKQIATAQTEATTAEWLTVLSTGLLKPQQHPAIAQNPEPVPPPPPPQTPPPTRPAPPPAPIPLPVTPPRQSSDCPDPNAPQVLVAEVAVSGVEGELQNEVYRVIRTQPGRTTNRCQLQEDINGIFATGLFSTVDYQPQDTPLGVRVTFVVQQNPILQSVVINAVPAGAAGVVPQSVVDEIFRPQYGTILNLRQFQEGVRRLNQWYKDNGYILAQVIASSPVDNQGRVTLQVAEGVVEDVQIRFLNKEGEATDEEGNPIRGRTREFIITREMALKPGGVLNETSLIADLRRLFGLGIFEKVEPSLNPGQDPRKVVVVLNVTERNTGSLGAGAGLSSATGLFGTVSYQESNLGGNNQKLGAQLQVSERALLFDVSFTDPWIAGDPFRTSYTVNGFRRRSISLIFAGGPNEVELPDDQGRPRIVRTGGGVTFTRPLTPNPLVASEWTASLGLQYQRVETRDSDGDIATVDEAGSPLSFSGDGQDDLTTVQFGLVRDLRDNALKPTRGSVLRLTTEQSIPIGAGNILLNRLRGSYSQYVPVNFFRFAEGAQTLAFNFQIGTILGDLPPYEAFALGGSNSVRGFDEGDLGSGRSFVQATAEYRFPVFSFLNGALFVDFGSDLGSGSSVPGDPAGVRGKPGTGLGYGLGVRVDTPLGPIRVDYGFSTEGDARFHFGIGERF
ncbi:BamA/TamA family outer membrane protein [Ancylothrix sp. C2]|uniref:BamA/TamA family outer membrane protein n=1 Tax=Ancylothrix sp. D3o TaxID=2953691 RepID=UPI0021BB1DE2|nr:BamA/TamA family outer membrane protein [Ancylothrix sp. D3o]MCT7948447.1 BamA/TamA family outer membrane protein [Ancylothrix sp. D3o]